LIDWRIEEEALVGVAYNYRIDVRMMRETRDGRYTTVQHLMGTDWVNPETFIPAFKRALVHFAVFDEAIWRETLAYQRRVAYQHLCRAEAGRRLGYADTQPISPEEVAKINEVAERLMSVAWSGGRAP
jgi:hypothetical protein